MPQIVVPSWYALAKIERISKFSTIFFWKVKIVSPIVVAVGPVLPDWAIFKSYLVTNFNTTVAQKFRDFLSYFEKGIILRRHCCGSFLGKF